MSLLAYTHDFGTLSGTILASQIGDDFTDVSTLLNGQLRTENLASDAGLVSTQLADRFYTWERDVELVPRTAGTDVDTSPTRFTIPATTGVRIKRRRIRVRAGKQIFLAAVSIYADDIEGGESIYVQVYRNGTAIAGMLFELSADDTFVEAAASSPFTDVAQSFSDGDVIEYRIYSATGAASASTIVATEHWKGELGA